MSDSHGAFAIILACCGISMLIKFIRWLRYDRQVPRWEWNGRFTVRVAVIFSAAWGGIFWVLKSAAGIPDSVGIWLFIDFPIILSFLLWGLLRVTRLY